MYIRSVKLKNIRCFPELEWSLENRPTRAGWHVILGDNGTGKSTFLRAISIAILGASRVEALVNLYSYIRTDRDLGNATVQIDRDWKLDAIIGPDSLDIESDRRSMLKDDSLGLSNNGNSYLLLSNTYHASVVLAKNRDGTVYAPEEIPSHKTDSEWRLVKRYGTSGWFSAGYGSLRRITGGDHELDKRLASNTDIARHFTLLSEAAALTESITWLQSLEFAKLSKDADAVSIDNVRDLINQPGFLPNDVRLGKVTNRAVEFQDANGISSPIEDLGDGYRSVLAMTLDLVRQLSVAYRGRELFTKHGKKITIDLPGVVLIDEIDVHLHPTWQRQIGPWFRRHFPNIQFIVTTHSPLVCQAAADGGSIFLLPSPGTEETGRFLEGIELDRLLYGDILDAYSTEAFGAGITRSEEAQKLYERLAVLNVKLLTGKLTAKERNERQHLQSIFASSLGFSPNALENGAEH